ncbi:hypothetical protein [Eisenibacter elegans]|uniref:hypothetical protein n=1 Tax=Eisenibacter elegans TaxID=997 RepID=UPI0004183646|nr:hypothetical protein [Eisenibacter elegans]
MLPNDLLIQPVFIGAFVEGFEEFKPIVQNLWPELNQIPLQALTYEQWASGLSLLEQKLNGEAIFMAAAAAAQRLCPEYFKKQWPDTARQLNSTFAQQWHGAPKAFFEITVIDTQTFIKNRRNYPPSFFAGFWSGVAQAFENQQDNTKALLLSDIPLLYSNDLHVTWVSA